jgi:hypothetical protein
MAKEFLRSIRYDKDTAEFIEKFEGKTFNESFDHMIAHCVKTLPDINKKIKEGQNNLKKLEKDKQKVLGQIYTLNADLRNMDGIEQMLNGIKDQLKRIEKRCEDIEKDTVETERKETGEN